MVACTGGGAPRSAGRRCTSTSVADPERLSPGTSAASARRPNARLRARRCRSCSALRSMPGGTARPASRTYDMTADAATAAADPCSSSTGSSSSSSSSSSALGFTSSSSGIRDEERWRLRDSCRRSWCCVRSTSTTSRHLSPSACSPNDCQRSSTGCNPVPGSWSDTFSVSASTDVGGFLDEEEEDTAGRRLSRSRQRRLTSRSMVR
mmetsp:Transcript_3157/g.9763  ORF Transcript_3157/g.9763 Transcript_3157/m.9763 type:complete len:207 (-) Transcript_3157:2745-3365(-)